MTRLLRNLFALMLSCIGLSLAWLGSHFCLLAMRVGGGD